MIVQEKMRSEQLSGLSSDKQMKDWLSLVDLLLRGSLESTLKLLHINMPTLETLSCDLPFPRFSFSVDGMEFEKCEQEY